MIVSVIAQRRFGEVSNHYYARLGAWQQAHPVFPLPPLSDKTRETLQRIWNEK